MNNQYDSLRDVFMMAVNEAISGKGGQRHGTSDKFENQQLCSFMREAGLSPAMYQIQKKARELLRFKGKNRKERVRRELLGIIIYAAAAVIVNEEVHEKGS